MMRPLCARQPQWWNGRRAGLKIQCPRGRGGSSPSWGTTSKGLPAQYVENIRDIVSFLSDIEDIDEVFDLRKYKPHRLTGDRVGTYSFSVTPNWRITFRHDPKANEVFDLDYEDYH